MVDLANVYKSQQQYRRAIEYCAEALDVYQHAPGRDPVSIVALHTALAALQLAEQGTLGTTGSSELAEAERNLAAARKICTEQGWLDGPAGIGVMELEAVVDVRAPEAGCGPQNARRGAGSVAPFASGRAGSENPQSTRELDRRTTAPPQTPATSKNGR